MLLLLLAQLWIEGTRIGVPMDNGKSPTVVYVWGMGETASENAPRRALPPDEWHVIDLASPTEFVPLNLPADIKAVWLSGILRSTYPGYEPISNGCGMVLNFRAPGSTLPGFAWQMQAASASPGVPNDGWLYPPNNGAVGSGAVVVPVKDRKFEFFWHAANPLCPMAISLSLQAYVR